MEKKGKWKKYCQAKSRLPRKIYRLCTLCKKVAYSESEWRLQQHGRSHLAKAERNNQTFTCEVCGIEGFESSHHRQHITSKAHFHRLNQRKRSPKTTEVTPVVSTSILDTNNSSNSGCENDTGSNQSSVRTPSPEAQSSKNLN